MADGLVGWWWGVCGITRSRGRSDGWAMRDLGWIWVGGDEELGGMCRYGRWVGGCDGDRGQRI